MVIINPNNPFDPYPNNPWTPQPQPFIDPYPDTTGTFTIERIKEVEKKWKERHIKDVKKGILITFKDGEDPVFIATDDECWTKIMDAVKDEPRKDNK